VEHQKIDGQLFFQMMLEGANNLNKHVKSIDALNVFPVPDGDTGTNMNLSLTSGVTELKNKCTDHIGKNADALAKGLLMGARGNSGVILSQLFRGFSKHIISSEEIDSKQFAEALKLGVDTAYKAVMKPVEGTILTVSREAAEEGIRASRKEADITKVMQAILNKGKESLAKTPELLPILKEVGVVDAGGQGLLYIYEGFLAVLKGEKLDSVDFSNQITKKPLELHKKEAPVQAKLSVEEIEFGYCTEFIIGLNEEIIKNGSFIEENFRNELSQMGDSIVVVSDDEIVKVHIHSEQPGIVLNKAMTFGSLHKIKIENMREQHSHILLEEGSDFISDDEDEVNGSLNNVRFAKSKQLYGFIAVAMGEGVTDIFKSLGVDVVISGGQTMNPSTEDIVNAINQVNAENIIILPNNSNIILAAEQAQSLLDQPIAVVPSKSIPQGISSLLAFNPNSTLEENKETMIEALGKVKTGQVTYAVRDSKFENIEIKEGDFLGIADGKIVTTTTDLIETASSLLNEMIASDEEILTIIYGQDVNEEQVKQLEEEIMDSYPNIEIEIHNGGQPIYYFIFSID